MPDVRTMKPVGQTAKAVQAQMTTGYQAQGFALAQSMIATVITHAQAYMRHVMSAFELDAKAREETIRGLKQWQKDITEESLANANLKKAGHDDKGIKRLAASASVRISQFNQVVKAMNSGMTKTTLAKACGVGSTDVGNIGFDVVVKVSREFNASQAGKANTRRPADALGVKLSKWLASQKVTGADVETKAEVIARLADILPQPEAK